LLVFSCHHPYVSLSLHLCVKNDAVRRPMVSGFDSSQQQRYVPLGPPTTAIRTTRPRYLLQAFFTPTSLPFAIIVLFTIDFMVIQSDPTGSQLIYPWVLCSAGVGSPSNVATARHRTVFLVSFVPGSDCSDQETFLFMQQQHGARSKKPGPNGLGVPRVCSFHIFLQTASKTLQSEFRILLPLWSRCCL
jgi:hypothetical protein